MVVIPFPVASAGVYEDAAREAVQWLESSQNPDGSWGAEDTKTLYTSEAVTALRNFYNLSAAYYAGITWLENHNGGNLDYASRKISTLYSHGDNIQAIKNRILSSLKTDSASSGWGVSDVYYPSHLDTAIVMLSIMDTGWNDVETIMPSILAAHNSVEGCWGINADTYVCDPVTTALILQAINRYRQLDGTQAYENSPEFLAAENYLAVVVDTSASIITRSQTILALLPQGRFATKVNTLVDSLITDQVSGGWDNDAYTTALAAKALSQYLGYDPDAKSQLCNVMDQNLRRVMNQTLEKNTGDALTLGETESIDTLSAAEASITDLTGITCASNLTAIDISNNNISDLRPLMDLLALNPSVSIILDGNPISDALDADGDGFYDRDEVVLGTDPLDGGSAPGNLVQNGDFSETIRDYWYIARWYWEGLPWQYTLDKVSPPNSALFWVDPEESCVAMQDIQIVPQRNYTLSLWAKGHNTWMDRPSGVSIVIREKDAVWPDGQIYRRSFVVNENEPHEPWAKIDISFYAPDGDYDYITLRVSGGSYGTLIDDVELYLQNNQP